MKSVASKKDNTILRFCCCWRTAMDVASCLYTARDRVLCDYHRERFPT